MAFNAVERLLLQMSVGILFHSNTGMGQNITGIRRSTSILTYNPTTVSSVSSTATATTVTGMINVSPTVTVTEKGITSPLQTTNSITTTASIAISTNAQQFNLSTNTGTAVTKPAETNGVTSLSEHTEQTSYIMDADISATVTVSLGTTHYSESTVSSGSTETATSKSDRLAVTSDGTSKGLTGTTGSTISITSENEYSEVSPSITTVVIENASGESDSLNNVAVWAPVAAVIFLVSTILVVIIARKRAKKLKMVPLDTEITPQESPVYEETLDFSEKASDYYKVSIESSRTTENTPAYVNTSVEMEEVTEMGFTAYQSVSSNTTAMEGEYEPVNPHGGGCDTYESVC